MVDDILSRGLLAEMGLPNSIITSVFTTKSQTLARRAMYLTSGESDEDEEGAPGSFRPRSQQQSLRSSAGDLLSSAVGSLTASASSLLPGLLNMYQSGATTVAVGGVQGAPSSMAVIERGGGRDGRRITMFKTLGRAVALAV